MGLLVGVVAATLGEVSVFGLKMVTDSFGIRREVIAALSTRRHS